MYENNSRLIDEAIASEPIKNTFRLGWEFLTLNKKFTMSVMLVLLALSLLGLIPIVGFIFSVFSSAFLLAMQIYVGRLVYETEDIELFVSEVHNVEGQNVIERYFSPALGAYLGLMVMLLLFVGVISLMVGDKAVDVNNYMELSSALSGVWLPMLIVTLLISYVQPLVLSNIVMANDFKDGLLAVFTIFSADVWRAAMTGSYFKYIFVYGLCVLLSFFLFSMVFSVFAVIPILNIITLMVFVYLLSIMMSVSAVMVRRIVESE